MRRFLAILATSMASLMLVAGCGGENDSQSQSSPEPLPTVTQRDTSAADEVEELQQAMLVWSTEALPLMENLQVAWDSLGSADPLSLPETLTEIELATGALQDKPCPDQRVAIPMNQALALYDEGTALAQAAVADDYNMDLVNQATAKWEEGHVKLDEATAAMELVYEETN